MTNTPPEPVTNTAASGAGSRKGGGDRVAGRLLSDDDTEDRKYLGADANIQKAVGRDVDLRKALSDADDSRPATADPQGQSGKPAQPGQGGQPVPPPADGQAPAPSAPPQNAAPAADGQNTAPATGGQNAAPAADGQKAAPQSAGQKAVPAAPGQHAPAPRPVRSTPTRSGGANAAPATGEHNAAVPGSRRNGHKTVPDGLAGHKTAQQAPDSQGRPQTARGAIRQAKHRVTRRHQPAAAPARRPGVATASQADKMWTSLMQDRPERQAMSSWDEG